MKRNLMTIFAVGAFAAGMAFAQTATTPTAADPSAPAKAASFKARLQRRMMQALNLTADQKSQAKAIRQTTKQQAQPLAQQLKQQRQALTAAVEAGDSSKIQQLSTQVGTLQGQVLAVRSAGMAQFYALLTPDQKAKAADFRQKAQQLLGAKGGQGGE